MISQSLAPRGFVPFTPAYRIRARFAEFVFGAGTGEYVYFTSVPRVLGFRPRAVCLERVAHCVTGELAVRVWMLDGQINQMLEALYGTFTETVL